MLLPYLPDEETTDLTEEGFPGCVAVWRPMDLEDKARWADECRKHKAETNSVTAAFLSVRQQLLRISGMKVQVPKSETDKTLVEVDFNVEEHFNHLGLSAIVPIHQDIETKASLSEMDIKNFERPSVLNIPSGTAASGVVPVAKEIEIPSGVSSPDMNANPQSSQTSTV
jgi:hypothetical protein